MSPIWIMEDCSGFGGTGMQADIDILPALKHEDSLYRTAMPDRKNVLGRVDVAVVSDTTLTGGNSLSAQIW